MPKNHRKLPTLTPQDIKRFWSLVDIRGPDECWPWQLTPAQEGYGKFKVQRVTVISSRVAYFLNTGVDLLEYLACHHCDNPPCCNPSHLFKGTNDQNMEDMVRKGRSAKGERNASHHAHIKADKVADLSVRPKPDHVRRGEAHGIAKLTDSEAIAFFHDPRSARRIAIERGVAASTIERIKNGKGFKHLHLTPPRALYNPRNKKQK